MNASKLLFWKFCLIFRTAIYFLVPIVTPVYNISNKVLYTKRSKFSGCCYMVSATIKTFLWRSYFSFALNLNQMNYFAFPEIFFDEVKPYFFPRHLPDLLIVFEYVKSLNSEIAD